MAVFDWIIMLAVAIITAPRAKPTITETLDSFYQCWDVKPWVFAEPGSFRPYHHWLKWCENSSVLKNLRNWHNAARTMLATHDEPYIAIMEDDIVFHTMAPIRVRQRILLGEQNAFSPYCSLVNRREAAPDGWIEARTEKAGWCGNQFMVFSRELLTKVVEQEDKLRLYSKGRDGSNEDYYHADYAVGRVVEELGRKILAHQPTLVLHQDAPSTNEANNRAKRVNKARLPAL